MTILKDQYFEFVFNTILEGFETIVMVRASNLEEATSKLSETFSEDRGSLGTVTLEDGTEYPLKWA